MENLTNFQTPITIEPTVTPLPQQDSALRTATKGLGRSFGPTAIGHLASAMRSVTFSQCESALSSAVRQPVNT
jgi:hypothetical protein